jgi:hypothetical protein
VTGHVHEWLPQRADDLRCACGETVTGLELAASMPPRPWTRQMMIDTANKIARERTAKD